MAFYLCNSASNDIIDEANATNGDKRSQQIPETYISDIRSYDNVLIVEKGDGSTSSVEFESFIEELEIPTVSTALTYNGNPQSPNFSNYFPYKMTISGTLSAIEDGIYEVAFTPNAGYVWADGTKKATKVVTWTINPIVISAVPSQSGELRYTGEVQSPTWANYNPDQMTIEGTLEELLDGSYEVTFTPKTGYVWPNGTSAAYVATWKINPILINDVPSTTDLIYNGNLQTPIWDNYNSSYLTYGGASSGTNAGIYTATFTPKTGHAWSDGTKSTKSVNWSIGKAAGSMSLSATSVTLNASNLTQTVTVTRAGDGAISASSNNTGVATVSVSGNSVTISHVNQTRGTATITVNVAESTNYYAPQGQTIDVNADFIPALNDCTWALISSISSAGTAANYWSVGDVKYITLNGKVGDKLGFNGMTLSVFILGFDHNASIEGSGISFGTFKTTDGIDVCLSDAGTEYEYFTDGSKIFNFNHWGNYNYGGWKASDIRYDILGSTNVAPSSYGSAKTTSSVGYDATTSCATSPVSNTLMAVLPADLRAVMKPITKYTDNTGNKSNTLANVTTSVDYLPLLSEYEIQGGRTYANTYESNYQAQYQYYINGNSKVKYTHMYTDTARIWWMRSPDSSNTISFCRANTDGGAGSNGASGGRGLSCTFLV